MIDRRQFLKVGAASIAVLGCGAALFAATRRPDVALAPWSSETHNYADPRLRALSYGILAPNPHNRQPWVAELIGDTALALTCDLSRRLPETDPFDRQITIGLGCFLELFALAAATDGYRTEMEYFPEGAPQTSLDSRPIARLRLIQDEAAEADPLFVVAKDRRSNKEPYDTNRPVPEALLTELLGKGGKGLQVRGTVEPGTVSFLRDVSWRAHEVESFTPRTMQESIDLMRIGKAEINANPDGIDMGGFGLELLAGAGFLSREQLADAESTAFRQGLKMFKDLMFSAMGHVWIVSPDNSRRQQLLVGREWLRLNLRATALGLAVQPLSQALQEYDEMKSLYRELHEALEIAEPARIQMFARIGYGPTISPSPRWSVERCVKPTMQDV